MSRKKTFEEFVEEARLKHPNSGYMYDKSTYINTHTPTKIICPKHGEFWTTPKSHLLYECKACSYEKRAINYTLSTENFIEKAIQIHGDKYDYSKVDYKDTKTPIRIICSKHGEFWQKPNDHLSGKGCSKCNESHLECKTEKFLKENKIKYTPQYKVIWLGKQSLDFYLPEHNIAIECQGKQHFGVGGWGDNFNYNEVIERDKRKYLLCQENNIDIIYLIDKRNKSYIKEDIIYKNKIHTDLNYILEYITKKGSE